MKITRRSLFAHTAAFALSAPPFVIAEHNGLSFARAALAETAAAPGPPPTPKLMDPGPFPDWVLGSSNAPVTIIEYSSMTCSHCAEFAITTFPDLKTEFVDTGKVQFIAREFPLDDLAAVASMLNRSVGADHYYDVMAILFQQQRQWLSNRIQPLMTLAIGKLGFTQASFNACLADPQLVTHMTQAYKRAQALHVTATPSFFINGEKVASGYMSIRQMESQISTRLKS